MIDVNVNVYAGKEFKVMFVSVVRTRHVVEQLCDLQLTPGALLMHQQVAGLSAPDLEDKDKAAVTNETDLFKFVDFADFGFLTSILFFLFDEFQYN